MTTTKDEIIPLVLMGASGAGKGTIVARMRALKPDVFGFSVSHTSRAPRPGEVDGVNYHFRTRAEIDAMIAAGAFLEHADVHGNVYGTSEAAVREVCAAGRICIIEIDVQGAAQLRRRGFRAHYIFVDVPSWDELERRLRGRGTEKESDIALRLENARREVEASREPGFVDFHVVNDTVDNAVAKIFDYIKDDLAAQAAFAKAH